MRRILLKLRALHARRVIAVRLRVARPHTNDKRPDSGGEEGRELRERERKGEEGRELREREKGRGVYVAWS